MVCDGGIFVEVNVDHLLLGGSPQLVVWRWRRDGGGDG